MLRLLNILNIKHKPGIKFLGFKCKNSRLMCQLKYMESINVDEIDIELVISNSSILNNIVPTEVKQIIERHNQYLQEKSLGNQLDDMYEITADGCTLVLDAGKICANKEFYSKLTHENLLMIASKYYFDLGFQKGTKKTNLKSDNNSVAFKVIK